MALFALSSAPAQANGRYPAANQLVVGPNDPTHLVARTTFGLLASSDEGRSWSWVCESAVGLYGTEDPSVALTESGATIVASSAGLATSTDDGCSWAHNSGLPDEPFGVDVTVVPARPHEALAVVSTYRAGVYAARVVHTTDDGASFVNMGQPFARDFIAETIEVARSRPERVYVSGRVLSANNVSLGSALQRSDDGGLTWVRAGIETAPAESVFIGAVDPTDPDTIYVRTRSDAQSRVLQSRDGGQTWGEIWQTPSPVLGLALSTDGGKLAVGSPEAGVRVTSTATLAFEQVSAVGAQCLTWRGEQLLACGNEAVDGFLLGTSDDDGRHFAPLLHQAALAPRACPEGTMAARSCPAEWASVAALLGVDAAPDGGSDGSPDGGRGDDSPPSAPASAGCGCRAAGSRHQPAPSAACALALAVYGFARRRRTRPAADRRTRAKSA